ncbi:MAG: hypothetical protein H0X24_05925 [Ktedonobacterales bacterium]|nr:hypothetical protein [Ktedonobacterales bacterium]
MHMLACPRCNGKGKSVAFREREHIYMSWYTWQECPLCQGTGHHRNRLATTRPMVPLTESVMTLAACLGSPPSTSAGRSETALLTTFKL